MRRSPATFSKAKRVKAVARKRVGSPRPARIILEKTRDVAPKHKNLLYDLVEE